MKSRSRFSVVRARFAPLVVALTALGCSGDDESGVSYKTDFRPLLQQRCVYCHFEGVVDRGSLDKPFTPETGLFTLKNRWFDMHRGLEYNVVPRDPDDSFLVQKLSDTTLLPSYCDPAQSDVTCPVGEAGPLMPPPTPRATPEQIEWVEDWIRDGARDTPTFRSTVAVFFGKSWLFGDGECANGLYAPTCIRCNDCHNPDAPTTPDLQVPRFEDDLGNSLSTPGADPAIDAWLAQLVGVKARYRSDLQLIDIANPDASFLLMKLKAELPSTAVGAPMPLALEPFTEAQVDMVRQWISEGARNN